MLGLVKLNSVETVPSATESRRRFISLEAPSVPNSKIDLSSLTFVLTSTSIPPRLRSKYTFATPLVISDIPSLKKDSPPDSLVIPPVSVSMIANLGVTPG